VWKRLEMTRTVSSESEKLDNVVIQTDSGNEYTVGEIKHSDRIIKSVTPKYTLDWYLKWFSSLVVLAAMSIRGIEELIYYDLILSIIGITGWLTVSVLWKDRALILLNGVGLIMFMNTLFTKYLFVST
jgi:hypothetical protein